METATAAEPKKRGPKKGSKRVDDSEIKVNASIYAKQADIDYLLTWNAGGTSAAFAEMIEGLRRVHPTGRFSAPVCDPAARNRPGTKTDLKRQIKALTAQIKKAGLIPVTEPTPPPAGDHGASG